MKEEEESACSDGTFHTERYFTCPAGRGFFVLLENCRPDSRFANSPTTGVSLNAEKGKQAKFENCTENGGKCDTFNTTHHCETSNHALHNTFIYLFIFIYFSMGRYLFIYLLILIFFYIILTYVLTLYLLLTRCLHYINLHYL